MGPPGHEEPDGRGRGAQPVADQAWCRAEGLLTLVTDAPLGLPRLDTQSALASLASGWAGSRGAEWGCGGQDDPPGWAWTYGHEEYVWPPVFFTTSPHHGLV
jgi:hypothetical protein